MLLTVYMTKFRSMYMTNDYVIKSTPQSVHGGFSVELHVRLKSRRELFHKTANSQNDAHTLFSETILCKVLMFCYYNIIIQSSFFRNLTVWKVNGLG